MSSAENDDGRLIPAANTGLSRLQSGLVSRGLVDVLRLRDETDGTERLGVAQRHEIARPERRLTRDIAEAFLRGERGTRFDSLDEVFRTQPIYTAIDDDAAETLSRCHGWCYQLYHNGVAGLSDAAANSLGRTEGDLSLNGLRQIRQATAVGLARQKGRLYLDGLVAISDEVADALGQHRGTLWLNGLTQLSARAAEGLARHRGWTPSNSDLRPWADELGISEGGLFLCGLKSISDAAAIALGRHRGSLVLEGLTSLSDCAAAGLACHEGRLSFLELKWMSENAAAALSRHQGPVYRPSNDP
jgi:hypothetical protein